MEQLLLTGSDQATTPVEPLSGDDALPLVALATVGAEHISYFAATDTNIAGGYVGLGTDVLAQARHEGAAELADLAITLALGVEVGASLATTHIHCRPTFSISYF